MSESFTGRGRQAWTRRYDTRPPTMALGAAEIMSRTGLLTFGPAGRSLGVDGAGYIPATARAGTATEPVLIVAARGDSELIRGWADEASMTEWAAGRGTAATGPLAAPPVPAPPRAWLEDVLLARLLGHPEEIPTAREFLPPATFTSYVRYEVYEALLGLSAMGRAPAPRAVAAEIGRQLGRVPRDGMTYYGGAGAPLVGRYLFRLAQTHVAQDEAADAIAALYGRDRAHDHAAAGNLIPAPSPRPSAQQGPAPAAGAPGPLLEQPPGPEPGGPAGPVQGR